MRSTTSRRPSLRACALVSVVTVAALLSACGSDSDSASDTDSTGVATSDATADTTEVDTTEAGAGDTTVDTTSDSGSAAGPATRDDYVAAFATNYAVFNDDEQDRCIGEMFVTAIGEDQLTASGVTPAEVSGVGVLSELDLSIDQETLPSAIEDLAACGDLVTVMLASSTATAEQTACATDILSNEIAAELLLVQVTGLEPSAEFVAANDAINGCVTTTTAG